MAGSTECEIHNLLGDMKYPTQHTRMWHTAIGRHVTIVAVEQLRPKTLNSKFMHELYAPREITEV